MNFKDVVTLSDLVMGDRFYFLGNKAKVSHVLLDIESTRTVAGYTYTATYLESIWQDKRVLLEKQQKKLDISKYIKRQKEAEKLRVVFLRHQEAIA